MLKIPRKVFFLKLIFLLLILAVFKTWLGFQSLSSGDWLFLFEENIKEFSFIPPIRLGVYFPLDFFFQSTAKILDSLGFSWPLIERLVWFWPFLILTIFSSWYLAKTLFPKEEIIQFLTPFIYLFNTYILMVVGGGQMGVALAYALAPLVLGMFIREFSKKHLRGGRLSPPAGGEAMTPRMVKGLILTGVVLAIQLMFDPRIAFLTIGAVVLYFVFGIKYSALSRWRGKYMLFALIVPVIIAVLLHSYWLFPVIFEKKPVLPPSYGESGWIGFLSFANFSESFSLLHPNWPENIFGKTYLMQPEFLILPMLAFSSLLFINYSPVKELKSLKNKELKNPLINNSLITNRTIVFFAFLGLIGAFLAKGSNSPFGRIYIWLFKYFPGMRMFRDSSKFYTLITLSYSILIPYSLKEIYLRIKR